MKKLFSLLLSIETNLREINGHLLYLCHLAERYAFNEERRKMEDEYGEE